MTVVDTSPRELALAIQVLRDTHYRHCRHGEWSEECPVFVAWAKRWPARSYVVVEYDEWRALHGEQKGE